MKNELMGCGTGKIMLACHPNTVWANEALPSLPTMSAGSCDGV